MAGPESDSEEPFDEDLRPQLLPPDDRLWRHPSEVGFFERAVADEARTAREHWMSSTPTRAGAWSAGLVGAMLATGVVFVGMHLTSWVSRSPTRSAVQSLGATTTLASIGAPNVNSSRAHEILSTVSGAMAVVRVTKGNHTYMGDGLAVASNGMILVPLSLVTGATAVEVDGWNQVLSARVYGSDAETGLAVLSVGCRLTPATFATSSSLTPGGWVATEFATSSQLVLDFGGVVSMQPRALVHGGYPFARSVTLDFSPGEVSFGTTAKPGSDQVPANLPKGAVLVNAFGQIEGVITGHDGDSMVEIPAGLAVETAHELVTYGRVEHGYLGVNGIPAIALPETRNATDRSVGTTAPAKTPQEGPASLPSGLQVEAVRLLSPAAAAGLRRGDIIEAVNGEPVASMKDLDADLYFFKPSMKVSLTILRGDSTATVEAELQKAG